MNTVLMMNNHRGGVSNSHNRLSQKMAVLAKLTYDIIYSLSNSHSKMMKQTFIKVQIT